jgi:hypothetical protein
MAVVPGRDKKQYGSPIRGSHSGKRPPWAQIGR